METSCHALDREIDADDTLRVQALTDQHLAAFDEMHELDTILPGRTSLSFDLLMALRRLTPTVRASGAHSVSIARARRSVLALANVYLRLVLAFVGESAPWLRGRAAHAGVSLRARAILVVGFFARAFRSAREGAPVAATRGAAWAVATSVAAYGGVRARALAARRASRLALARASLAMWTMSRVVATARPWGWATRKARSLAD